MSTQYYYEPFFSFSDFDRLIDDAFTVRPPAGNHYRRRQVEGSGPNTSALIQPKVDVHESTKDNKVTATFELPGLKKEDVTIDVHNNRLIVSGEYSSSNEEEKEGYVVRERREGKFSRTLPLPAGIKAEEIKASMEHGLLRITFPKATPEQEAKRIAIA
ncbi:small heat shock protein [Rickenella mellea]|uniref:Small heat shock protein n=1 Tax=Rickenella mellea TaxID=50990 RepID=A0A4Y7QCZ3_9AGAM|nr:small heat shock protein [Rickenella mellea]